MWRTLVYDRQADVVIVRDVVHASHAEFRKRWLLHTQQEPMVIGDRFTVRTPPDPARRVRGGSLHGQVLLPVQSELKTVGGPGFEFWVDGKNYDENGTLAAAIARKGQPTEAGAWRIELSPSVPEREDEFLVVLIPRLAGDDAIPEIRRLTDGRAYGVEIRTGGITRSWWFRTGEQGVQLETRGQRIPIGGDPAAASRAAPTQWERLKAWWQRL
jgi:hypothetical protein